jgi:hypothetical protein
VDLLHVFNGLADGVNVEDGAPTGEWDGENGITRGRFRDVSELPSGT